MDQYPKTKTEGMEIEVTVPRDMRGRGLQWPAVNNTGGKQKTLSPPSPSSQNSGSSDSQLGEEREVPYRLAKLKIKTKEMQDSLARGEKILLQISLENNNFQGIDWAAMAFHLIASNCNFKLAMCGTLYRITWAINKKLSAKQAYDLARTESDKWCEENLPFLSQRFKDFIAVQYETAYQRDCESRQGRGESPYVSIWGFLTANPPQLSAEFLQRFKDQEKFTDVEIETLKGRFVRDWDDDIKPNKAGEVGNKNIQAEIEKLRELYGEFNYDQQGNVTFELKEEKDDGSFRYAMKRSIRNYMARGKKRKAKLEAVGIKKHERELGSFYYYLEEAAVIKYWVKQGCCFIAYPQGAYPVLAKATEFANREVGADCQWIKFSIHKKRGFDRRLLMNFASPTLSSTFNTSMVDGSDSALTSMQVTPVITPQTLSPNTDEDMNDVTSSSAPTSLRTTPETLSPSSIKTEANPGSIPMLRLGQEGLRRSLLVSAALQIQAGVQLIEASARLAEHDGQKRQLAGYANNANTLRQLLSAATSSALDSNNNGTVYTASSAAHTIYEAKKEVPPLLPRASCRRGEAASSPSSTAPTPVAARQTTPTPTASSLSPR